MYLTEVQLEWLLPYQGFRVGLRDLSVKVSKDPPCVQLEARTAGSKPRVHPSSAGATEHQCKNGDNKIISSFT